MSRKNKDSPFATLAGLKARPFRPVPGPEPVLPPQAGEEGMLRDSLKGVKPLANPNLARIERPRPAAVPRPRGAEPDVPKRVAGPDSRDPLASAYEGVVPLADSGRVDLSSARHRKPLANPLAESHVREELPADPLALFHHLVRGATPLADTGRVLLTPPPPAAIPRPREETPRGAPAIVFEDRHALPGGEAEEAFLRPGLPRRVLADLRRGRREIQGELDLHDMSRDEARDALAHFLGDSLDAGRRCIRLIHGQGHGSPGRESLLRQLSRAWLSQREEVLAFCQAQGRDGGGGALVVLLRNVKGEGAITAKGEGRREKGKVSAPRAR